MIKTENYLHGNMLSSTRYKSNMEDYALNILVDAAAKEMKKKLYKKSHEEGYSGWDNPDFLPDLKQSLINHIEKGFNRENMIDVMNLAAMIWNQLQE